MKALRQQLALMAGTNGRVLIYGESGTGKELVAHALHAHEPAGVTSRFVEVNCAAIPEELDRERTVRPHEGQLHAGASNARSASFRKPTAGLCSWMRSGT